MFPAGSPCVLTATALVLAAALPAAAQQASTADIDRMMAVIEAQQRQIDAMRAELNALKSQRTAVAAPAASSATVAAVHAAASPDEDDRTDAQVVAEGFTWKDASGRSVTLSGQVNPAFNVVDDGVSTDVYIVDNDTSGTRFRLDADAPLGGTTIGATLEIGASPNNSYDISQRVSQSDADFNVRRAEVTFRDDRYGRLQLGKGSSAADDTAEYDLSLVAGPIMYAGVADIAGGILFTDGTELANFGTPDDPSYLAVGDAFFDFDGDRLARVRYDSPMFGPVQVSASYGQDDQWAAAVTLGGDYGDWSGWTVGAFTLLAAASVYTDDDTVDFGYAASGSVLHDPTGLSLTLSTGGYKLDAGDDPTNFYAKVGWDTEFWPLGPTGFGFDYTRGENISGDGAEGTSFGIAAVQKIERYGIDLYGQLRWYELDESAGPDLKNVTVGTFGTKFVF